eukprot:gene18187-24626_t
MAPRPTDWLIRGDCMQGATNSSMITSCIAGHIPPNGILPHSQLSISRTHLSRISAIPFRLRSAHDFAKGVEDPNTSVRLDIGPGMPQRMPGYRHGENLNPDFKTFEKFAKAGGASNKLVAKDVIDMGASLTSQARKDRAGCINLIVIKKNKVYALPLVPEEPMCANRKMHMLKELNNSANHPEHPLTFPDTAFLLNLWDHPHCPLPVMGQTPRCKVPMFSLIKQWDWEKGEGLQTDILVPFFNHAYDSIIPGVPWESKSDKALMRASMQGGMHWNCTRAWLMKLGKTQDGKRLLDVGITRNKKRGFEVETYYYRSPVPNKHFIPFEKDTIMDVLLDLEKRDQTAEGRKELQAIASQAQQFAYTYLSQHSKAMLRAHQRFPIVPAPNNCFSAKQHPTPQLEVACIIPALARRSPELSVTLTKHAAVFSINVRSHSKQVLSSNKQHGLYLTDVIRPSLACLLRSANRSHK